MKKALVILVVVLAAVFGLAPRWVGERAQERYEQIVERLRGEGAQITSTKYDRGWFGAHATTELVLSLPPTAEEAPQLPKELRVTLVSELRHGPLTSLGGIGLAEIETRLLLNGEQLFPQDYPARLHTQVALDGATRTLVDLPSATLPETDSRPAIDFRGLSGNLNVDAAFDHVDSRWESPGALISGGKIERIEIGSLSVNTKAARGTAGLMLGEAKVALTHVTAKGVEPGQALALTNLVAEASSAAEGELVTGTAHYHVGTLRFNEREFKDADLRISAGNLSAPVLVQIQKALDEIQAQRIPPQMQGTAIMSTLITQLPLLLEHNPTLAIENLQLVTPEGQVEGQLKVQALGMRMEDLQGGMGFLHKLQANARVKLPEALMRQLMAQRVEHQVNSELAQRREQGEELQAPAEDQLQHIVDDVTDKQIATLLEQRLIMRDDQSLMSTARFEQGKLTVNGQEVPLPFLPPAQ